MATSAGAADVKLHPDLPLHTLDWHSKRPDMYPTGPTNKWNKYKKEAQDKKLGLSFVETEKDLQDVWLAPSEAIIGTAIAETCGFCGQWMPEFMKLVPPAGWRPLDEMKDVLVESRMIRFMVLDKYSKATEVMGQYAGQDLGQRVFNSHPTIFLISGSVTGKDSRRLLHIFSRLGPFRAPDFPAGLTQDSYILGQIETKMPGFLKSPFLKYLADSTLTMAKTVSGWDINQLQDAMRKSFPPKQPQQQQQQQHQHSHGQATYVGIIAPPLPLVPVPEHLKKLPEMKVFFNGSLSRHEGEAALYVGDISMRWLYWQNTDQLMTPIAAACWQKMNNLRRSFNIPVEERESQSLIQTPTVEVILRDAKTGYAHASRYHAAEALNYLAGFEANLIAEGMIHQQKQNELEQAKIEKERKQRRMPPPATAAAATSSTVEPKSFYLSADNKVLYGIVPPGAVIVNPEKSQPVPSAAAAAAAVVGTIDPPPDD